MAHPSEPSGSLTAGLLRASAGAGPLLQRDYWAVIAACRLRPRALIDAVALRFAELAPEGFVRFQHASCLTDGRNARDREGMAVGDELQVNLLMAGPCRVRVVSRESQSFTLATLPGHPEAGRITHGAYRNDGGDVVYHIRSRARTSAPHIYVGFMAAGEAMQTATWTDFVVTVAQTFGNGVLGAVHAETEAIDDEEGDGDCGPTFVATGDEGP